MPKTAVALVVVRRGGRQYLQELPVITPSLAERIAGQAARIWARLVRTGENARRS